MARISRVVVPEHPHHVAQRGVRSMAIFQTHEEGHSYLHYLGGEDREDLSRTPNNWY
jgi:hypothetical protein